MSTSEGEENADGTYLHTLLNDLRKILHDGPEVRFRLEERHGDVPDAPAEVAEGRVGADGVPWVHCYDRT